MADMTLAEAMKLADQDSPLPTLAGQALKVLRAVIAQAERDIEVIAYRCDRTPVADVEHQLLRVADALRSKSKD